MQSSFKYTVAGVLGADVADAGTFTVSYPNRPAGESGTFNLGDGRAGVEPQIVVGGTTYNGPMKMSLAFGATVITVTNKSGATWKAGQSWTLMVPLAGRRLYRGERGSAPRAVARTTKIHSVLVTLGSPIATVDNNISVSASPGAAALTLVTAAGVTLDVPRNVILTSGGNDSGITFTVTGKDEYGNTMSEAIVGANAGVANGAKAFKSVTAITHTGSVAGTVKAGVGNVLGLPVFLPAAGHILKELQDGAVPTAGTTVAGVQTSGGSTTTTGDVRGTYVPNSAPDASKCYQLVLGLPDPDYLGMPQA